MEKFKNAEDRVFLSDGAATPAYTEIPVATIGAAPNKKSDSVPTNADYDAATGVLYDHKESTLTSDEYSLETPRFNGGEATPAMLAVLASLVALGKLQTPNDEGVFLFVFAGLTAYTQTCQVGAVKGFGGKVDQAGMLTIPLSGQGKQTAYEGTVPARTF